MFNFDSQWNLQPIKGDTGKAYKAIKDSERIFLKRNSTPFLAALSREKITPRLLWTKRTGDGDVLTAQEWLEARQLTETEMIENTEVIRILRNLHQSPSLKSMLKRIDGKEKSPFDFLCDYASDLPNNLKNNLYLTRVFRYLEDHIPAFLSVYYTACHGDTIHNNWLLTTDEKVYLVDWDYSVIADPALDIGTVLGQYVEPENWDTWLDSYESHTYSQPHETKFLDLWHKNYEVDESSNLNERIYWYAGMNLLLQIKRSYLREDKKQVNVHIAQLKRIYNY